MTLPRQWQRHALALMDRAGPLEREYFRSVELSYAHPDDVISREGTRLYGGRFVRPRVRAVYGSAEEQTAIREAAARKQRLAGGSGTRLADYPRIAYVIAAKLAVSVDLTFSDSGVEGLLPACLDQGFRREAERAARTRRVFAGRVHTPTSHTRQPAYSGIRQRAGLSELSGTAASAA